MAEGHWVMDSRSDVRCVYLFVIEGIREAILTAPTDVVVSVSSPFPGIS